MPFNHHIVLTFLDSRLTDAELLQYCHDPTIPERERLILTKRNTTPGGAELRRAQAIAKEQALAAHEKVLSERKDGSLGRTRTNKLEGFFGERPTSFQRPPPLPSSSSTTRFRTFSCPVRGDRSTTSTLSFLRVGFRRGFAVGLARVEGAWAAAHVVKNRPLSRVTLGVDVKTGLIVVLEAVRLGRETRDVRVVLTRDFGGGFLGRGLVSWKNPSKLTFCVHARGILAVSIVNGRVV